MSTTTSQKPMISTHLSKDLKKSGPALQTFSGTAFFFDQINPSDIYVADIARSLSRIVRFAGHTKYPYTVAQHSIAGSFASSNLAIQKWFLMHDASEAYITDIPTSVKHNFCGAGLRDLEHRIQEAVAERFDLLWPMPPEVNVIDTLLLETEATELFADGANMNVWGAFASKVTEARHLARKYDIVLPRLEEFVNEFYARSTAFMSRFDTLFNGKGFYS